MWSWRPSVALIAAAGCLLAAAVLHVAEGRGDDVDIPCAGPERYEEVLERGFDEDRWRDPTPLKRSERRELRQIRRDCTDGGNLRRMRREAKHDFHAHFRDMIDPPGRGKLASIRACESGTAGGYRAISAGGTYRGAYQFDFQTWASVGGQGDPADAPPREQDYRAAKLFRERGSQPWPRCG